MDERTDITGCYLKETRSLVNELKNNPQNFARILRALSMTKDNSRILGYIPVYKLYKALEDVYKALCDEKISFNENLQSLLSIVVTELNKCCFLIENKSKDIETLDVSPYLLFCDKAVAGEIFDNRQLLKMTEEKIRTIKKEKKQIEANEAAENAVQKDTILKIPSGEISRILNLHEEMIARTYIISNQVAMLKTGLAENDIRMVKEAHKLLSADSQNLQNSLRLAHERLLSVVQDESFLKNHQELQGFFITANDEKYLIPSEFIFDVICESPLNYSTVQNQKIVKYVIERENGTINEDAVEDIPVYSLSSLLPGQKTKTVNILDTILIVDYQSQKIGIIVDSVLKFVSVIKKNMPSAFDNFEVLKGIAFDEKYDMIPILHIPEIMRMFRSLRGYDVKKFEAISKKHVNKILIVDDSQTIRQIERTILISNGFMVDEASDGIEALEKIKHKQFDLIICDDEMPRMNGNILLDNIRRMDDYKSVPVVAMSDYPLERADAYVSKSDFTRDNLIQTIHRKLNDE